MNRKRHTLCSYSLEDNLKKLHEKIDTSDVEPMVYVMPMTNILRSDKREQPFERKALLDGAPQSTEDSWQVPRLVK